MTQSDQAQKLRELTKDMPAGVFLRHYRKRVPPKMVAIASGRGGVGKSFLALNLACFFALRSKHTLLVDADFSMGHLDYMLGLNPSFTIQHLVEGKADMEHVSIDGPWGLKLIPGMAGLNGNSGFPRNFAKEIIPDLAMHNDWTDILVADTTSGVSAPTVEVIANCDELILVTTPETGSVMDLYGMVKFLHNKLGDASPRMRLVVNRVMSRDDGRRVAASLRSVVGRFLGKGFNVLGYIPVDSEIEDAARKHIPFIRHAPVNPAARAIDEISTILLNEWADPLSSNIVS